jgi:cytochrome P450
MTMYSDVQKRAQAEIDSIVGRSRLPTVEDRDRMPFVNGVVLESLRWNPVIPLGLPHKAVEDDVYRGMLIPANATIFANVW